MLEIKILPLLKDNYGYFLKDPNTGKTAVVDPSESIPVRDFLNARKEKLDFILNTHHHWDHTGGNALLKEEFGSKVMASTVDGAKIDAVDISVSEGDALSLGAEPFEALAIPGHTLGHTAFYFPKSKAVFVGDTLFSMGCGRLFEGTPEQMWSSLVKLQALPDDTRIYCGHEYALSNAKFALHVEPTNVALVAYVKECEAKVQRGEPVMPTDVATEKAVNPFFRAGTAEKFAALRKSKDSFRG